MEWVRSQSSDKLNRRDRKHVGRASAYGQEAYLQI